MIPHILAAIGGFLIGNSLKRAQFSNGGSVLLAPNGKPSNLSPEQYRLVRTPQFKAWFGDWENDPNNASKVVDQNGEPLVCYHGSRSNFSVFDIDKSGESSTPAKVGFWFTPIKKFAYNFAETIWYGNSKNIVVYPLFLSIKNPKIYNSETDSAVRYPDSYQKFKIDIWALDGQSADNANTGGIGMALNNQKETIKKYRESLYNQGFDGVFIKNTSFDRFEAGGLNDQIVALFPNQIKLADGSNTTFDPENPDIRYAEGGQVTAMNYFDRTTCVFESVDPKDAVEILDQYLLWRKKKNKPETIYSKKYGNLKVDYESEKTNSYFKSRSLSYYFISDDDFIIRISDHWSKSKYTKSRKLNCSFIRSCWWENYGERFYYHMPSQRFSSELIAGICRFKDFKIR